MKKPILVIFLIFSISQIVNSPIITIRHHKPTPILTKTEKFVITLKEVESQNNYHITGKSGEYGAYQILKRTWNYFCTLHFDQILPMTPHNQDKVVKTVIDSLLKKYTVEEVAAIWNCGSPNYHNRIGVNKHGVKYNTPNYVKNFMLIYNGK